MVCAEFEGCLRDEVESFIDSLKRKKMVKDMHVCFLLQNFYGNNKMKKFSIGEILGLFKKRKKGINYGNFTRDKKPRYKSAPIERLFNSLGIFLNQKNLIDIKLLDGIASTRDAIAHGDRGILVTRKELEDNMVVIKKVYKILKKELKKQI